MKQFENDIQMLRELDDFIYKCKGFNSKLREMLINKIGEFLKDNNLDSDQHNFVSWNSTTISHYDKDIIVRILKKKSESSLHRSNLVDSVDESQFYEIAEEILKKIKP